MGVLDSIAGAGGLFGIAKDVASIAAPFVSAGTSAYGIAQQAEGQREANFLSQEMAREQMRFQWDAMDMQRQFSEKMANTAYERAMADMRRSGLNPILAYRQGGAATPGVSALSGARGIAGNPYQGASTAFTQAASSAMDAMKLPSEIDKLESEVKKVMADTSVSHAASYLKKLQADLTAKQIRTEDLRPEQVFAQIEKLGYDTAKVRAEIAVLQQAFKTASAEGYSSEVYEEFLRNNPWLREVEALGRSLGVVGQGVGLIRGLKGVK